MVLYEQSLFFGFQTGGRSTYSVSYKDESGKYLPPISTKQKTEKAAYQTAMQWLKDGIPAKQDALNIKQIEIKELSRKIETANDAKPLLDDLLRRGIIKSYVIAGTQQAQSLNEFLLDFWNWDTSAYIQGKNRKQIWAALVKTGMSAETAKQYTFHGWRHYFTTHMKPHLDGKLLKRETGHKTDIMLTHYSNHTLEGERQQIQEAQRLVFGALLPEEKIGS